jgi:hypothetical protein
MGQDGGIVEQWLGPQGALFPLSGLPCLTEENLITLFDISEKQRESLYFHHSQLPASINFDHTDEGETLLDREKCTLSYGGRTVLPLLTRGGLEFVDNDYLSPLADVAEMVELYERHTEDGGVYFAAKTGFMIAGVIMPLDIIDEKLLETLETLARKSRVALDLKNGREAELDRRRAASEGEQATFGGEGGAGPRKEAQG